MGGSAAAREGVYGSVLAMFGRHVVRSAPPGKASAGGSLPLPSRSVSGPHQWLCNAVHAHNLISLFLNLTAAPVGG